MTDKCTSPEGHRIRILPYSNTDLIIACMNDGCDFAFERDEAEAILNAYASLTEKVERLVTGGKKFSASIHYDNSPDDGYAIVDPQDWAEFAALLESEQDAPTALDPSD